MHIAISMNWEFHDMEVLGQSIESLVLSVCPSTPFWLYLTYNLLEPWACHVKHLYIWHVWVTANIVYIIHQYSSQENTQLT